MAPIGIGHEYSECALPKARPNWRRLTIADNFLGKASCGKTAERHLNSTPQRHAIGLARADGDCKCCDEAAPFKRQDGSPYLEPHHTRRLADGGPDNPRWVGAICPNCHREIHYGANGKALNDRLQARLKQLGDAAGMDLNRQSATSEHVYDRTPEAIAAKSP